MAAVNKNEKNLPPVSLSKRLQCIVELAGTGETVCDVGCDHAHVPIYLLQSGAFRFAIGMDVIEGPLGKAAGNLALYEMEDRVELRLSDGLNAYRKGEADTVVIAGMGGTLMRDILLQDPEKTKTIPVLVLGPHSDPDRVRAALRELDFVIEEERLIFEDGKYYPVLRAVHSRTDSKRTDSDYGRDTADSDSDLKSHSFSDSHSDIRTGINSISTDTRAKTDGRENAALFSGEIPPQLCREAEDLFGPVLLRRRDPLLLKFLTGRIRVLEKIRNSVTRAAADRKNEEEETGKDENRTETTEQVREKHLNRQREIEHTLLIYRAALTVFREK